MKQEHSWLLGMVFARDSQTMTMKMSKAGRNAV